MSPICKNYVSNTLLHLAGGFAIAAGSSVIPLTDIFKSVFDKYPMYGIVSVVVSIIAMIILVISLIKMPAGSPMKYFLAARFAFIIGQSLRPIIQSSIQRHTFTKILGLTVGVFAGMAVLGYYDTTNLLGFGQYLFAGLIGLVISQLFFYILILTGVINPLTDTVGTYIFSIPSVILFSLYIAHDVQIIKVNGMQCRGKPDYINESFKLFMDTINIFSNLSNIIQK